MSEGIWYISFLNGFSLDRYVYKVKQQNEHLRKGYASLYSNEVDIVV